MRGKDQKPRSSDSYRGNKNAINEGLHRLVVSDSLVSSEQEIVIAELEEQGISPIDDAAIRKFYRALGKNALAALATAAPSTEHLLDQEREAIALEIEKMAIEAANLRLIKPKIEAFEAVRDYCDFPEIKYLVLLADLIRARKSTTETE